MLKEQTLVGTAFLAFYQQSTSHGTRSARFGRLFTDAEKRKQNASSSSGRNEFHNPNSRASGDKLQSKMKEDEDLTNMLSTGVKTYSELGDDGAKNIKETFGTPDLTSSLSTLQRGVSSHAIASGHHSK